jgi:hypothetical protein
MNNCTSIVCIKWLNLIGELAHAVLAVMALPNESAIRSRFCASDENAAKARSAMFSAWRAP